MTINVSAAELLVICNALNAEANSFERFEKEVKKAPDSSMEVWRRKASDNRALSARLLEDAGVGEPTTGFDQAVEQALARRDRDLAARLEAERRMARALVKACLDRGHLISVNDGEEWVVHRSANKAEIMKALFSTDEDYLHLRSPAGEKLGWFRLIYGNEGYDVVSDHSSNDICDAIWNEVISPLSDKISAGG